MNWDQVQGKWKQYKGHVQEKWGKFTDDDMDVIDGNRQQLVGKIQERYGLAKEAAEKQADEFVNTLQTAGRGAAREEGRQKGRHEVRQEVRQKEKAHRSGQR
jgi:uncharacterized protein YjbJ (UPF0337 family)